MNNKTKPPPKSVLRNYLVHRIDEKSGIGPWGYFQQCLHPGYRFFMGGRAQRVEYWSFLLFAVPIIIAVYLLDVQIFGSEMFEGRNFIPIISITATLLLLGPFISLSVRRMHDVGLSGIIMIFVLGIPAVGLVVALLPSQQRTNAYGPHPKAMPIPEVD